MKCGALSVTTVEPCGNDKLSGKKYCATHQAQHEAGTLMAPDEMREKRDALIEGVRQGETVKALRERLGLSQVHASAWIKHSGVRDQMAAEEAERAAAREQAAAEAHAEREAHLGAEREAAEEAAELLRAFRPDYKTPQPMMPGLTPTFAFEPSDLLDLLNELILMRDTVRLLPLHAALATVRHKEVVMLTVAAGEDEAIPCEWGFLETAAAYKEGDAAWIDFPGWGTEVLALAPVASVSADGIVIPSVDDEGQPTGGAVIFAIADAPDEAPHFTLPDGMELAPERDWLRALVDGPEPAHRAEIAADIQAELGAEEDA